MATRGEAAGYYNAPPPPPANNNYETEDPMKYSQQPPQYNNYAPPPGPPMNGNPMAYGNGQQSYGEKQSFDQTFAIQKPKYNDWWAGLLFIAVFLGFTAVSGIAIQGYCRF